MPPEPAPAPSPSPAHAAAPARGELPKAYRPAEVEPRVRGRWDEAGAFHADPQRVRRGEARAYVVLIPPPNVTAALHLGHALNNTLQDILVRAHRMRGFETLWMPGTDHAGIATQAVVERRLHAQEGVTRQQLGREEFVRRVQAWKDEYEARITAQLKAMGCSCDFARQRFTMDEVCARAVREAFFRLFQDGLIYRGKRLVNWDPVLRTAVAEDETFDQEVDAAFYYLRYPLVAGAEPVTWGDLARRGHPGAADQPAQEPSWITVATTRPETYLGDTAVAVSPRDPRAASLRGLGVRLPLVGRLVPIVEDDYVVLPEALARTPEEAADPKAQFATGFLKVTPAHDQNDYELYQRHREVMDGAAGGPGRALVNVLAPDASISDQHGWRDVGEAGMFLGLPREEARRRVVSEFKARGLLEEVRPYRHSVKHSDRSKAVIEPYLSDQWYVRVTDERMAKAANEALAGGADLQIGAGGAGNNSGLETGATTGPALRFHPARYARTYELWHENIRDWCISRQLWWGHRIPVWTGAPAAGEELPARLAGWQNAGRVFVEPTGSGHLAAGHSAPAAWSVVHMCVRDENDSEVTRALEAAGFERDPDVLDTWFSSALWPMSTLGWPDPHAAARATGLADFPDLLAAFNPSSTLCTAREIITLWVSRMVMFNRYFMPEGWPGSAPGAESSALSDMGRGRGPVPFRDVFIHAMIQDGEGHKMSKSLGNGVDPLDIIESHGADAMRFTLAHMTTQTQDVRLPVTPDPGTGKNTSSKFDLGRNFCNKLWNAARFALSILKDAPGDNGSVGGAAAVHAQVRPGGLALVDRWMLSRLAAGIAEVDTALARFEFSDYAQALYDLLWRDFCDWYLEAIKPTVARDPAQRAVLAAALQTILRLLHPAAPFITEAIFERLAELPTPGVPGLSLLPSRRAGLLATAGWPVADAALSDPAAEERFETVRGLVTAIREVRAQHQVQPRRKVTLHAPAELTDPLGPDVALVRTLAELGQIRADAPAGPAVEFVFRGTPIHLADLSDVLDTGAERERLTRQLADLEKSIAAVSKRLDNPGYVAKAPAHLVEETKLQLAKLRAEREAAAAALERLG
ncbi:MAG TPA: valine--tRNA ligase [Phycisphaerales bacterium]|nr:valine--tRNA ligase [Phycisphaerales bacterium]